MQQHNVGDEATEHATQTIYDDEHEVQRAGIAELAIILGQLMTHFRKQAVREDLDMLSFGLHYLFCQIDSLYRVALPRLAACAVPTTNRPIPLHDFASYHHTWQQLQSLKRLLERIEALCHLLNTTTISILETLDIRKEEPLAPAETTAEDGQQAYERYCLETADPQQWEQAFTVLREVFHDWHSTGHHAFSVQFIHLLPSMPALAQADNTFYGMLTSASAIFGDILHDFHAISSHDDETVMVLLFDTMQQIDLLLIYIDSLLELLHTFIKYYSVMDEMN